MANISLQPDEIGFLARVQENFADDAPKLIYADWLEEHEDPRGAYLRAWVKFRRRQLKYHDYNELLDSWHLNQTIWAYVMGCPQTNQLIRDACPTNLVDEITQHFRAGFWFYVFAFPWENPVIGHTKRAGFPDLPASQRWPVYDHAPMLFLLQINLEQIESLKINPCAAELPPKGILSFFSYYGLQSEQLNQPIPVACCYNPHPAQAEPRPIPRQIPPEFLQERCHEMEPFLDVFYPPSFLFEGQAQEYAEMLLHSPINNRQDGRYAGECRFLGNPVNRFDCSLMRKYRLLLSGTFPIGRGASWVPLEFWISPEDLRNFRFDRVFGVVPRDTVE
ncbi:MAG: DUF1963 domain-containing protein [Gemmataceae bacterium]|nr:DUF1963 domain-containing protein [Gemmataceae bacterium]